MSQETDPEQIPASLATCPDTPNCVSSQADSASQRVAPFPCSGSCNETLARLQSILRSTVGAAVVVTSDSYLRAEFTSTLLRFVDDLELLVDRGQAVIHVRSASRVGHWDWGSNRRRVEQLRKRLLRIQG